MRFDDRQAKYEAKKVDVAEAAKISISDDEAKEIRAVDSVQDGIIGAH